MTKTEEEIKGVGTYYNASSKFIDENVNNGLGDKVAIYHLEEEITYKRLQENVNKFGNVLKSLGVQSEQRVLMVCNDMPEFISSFFGTVKIGAVPIPVNTTMQSKDYEYFLNNSRARVLVINEEYWLKIQHIKSRLPYLKEIIVISRSTCKEKDVIDYHVIMNSASKILDSEHTTTNDTGFWLYTSGSTGEPKGVVHLQKTMEHSYKAYANNILNINSNDITFSASKLFFAYGLGNGMYFPLGAGASTIVMPERPTAEKIFETIEKYKPTIFYGVPTLYGSMINLVEQTGRTYDLSCIRICVSAGEALPAEFIRKWKKLFNLDILDGIGSTEASHIFLSNSIGDIRPGSTGKVVPGYKAKIVNELGEPLPHNEIGDLLISGDSIASNYWLLHEENKHKFIGEWFHTGDKYYTDEDGYYWYCGRADDMMKVGGIWVSPIEIENSILGHASVLEVAVIPQIDKSNLVKPKACIVLKDGIKPSESLSDEIKQYVKTDLAFYKYPRIIEFVDELPKTATGKVQRFRLLESGELINQA